MNRKNIHSIFLFFLQWLGIGINFGNLPLSLWPLLFHGGLCGLFGLYFVFWLRLNMFETLKYLALIGAFTFIAGNRVLRSLANLNKLVFLYFYKENLRRFCNAWFWKTLTKNTIKLIVNCQAIYWIGLTIIYIANLVAKIRSGVTDYRSTYFYVNFPLKD